MDTLNIFIFLIDGFILLQIAIYAFYLSGFFWYYGFKQEVSIGLQAFSHHGYWTAIVTLPERDLIIKVKTVFQLCGITFLIGLSEPIPETNLWYLAFGKINV